MREAAYAERSALYRGAVVHRRFRPVGHLLKYKVFSILVDLDELPRLGRRLRWFSHNRFNLFSVHDRDHGAGDGRPLRPHVESLLRRAGIAPEGGTVRLLCYPRVLGYVFNPLSVYFCDDAEGCPAAVIYEVRNTFGQRHSYVIPAGSRERGGVLRQRCRKAFYVSPFMPMEVTYDFRILPPAEDVTIAIRQSDAQGPLMNASFTGRRRVLRDRELMICFLRYPLMTVKVIAGIHWEALKLWRKGLRLVKRPPAPEQDVTIVKVARREETTVG